MSPVSGRGDSAMIVGAVATLVLNACAGSPSDRTPEMAAPLDGGGAGNSATATIDPPSAVLPSSAEVEAQALFELMRVTHVSGPVLSFTDSIDASQHVVLATIESVVPGRVATPSDGGPTVRSVLFTLRLEEALKGDVPNPPNFEHLSGAIPAEAFEAEVTRDQRMIVLLASGDVWDLNEVQLEHLSPEVTPVFRLTQQYGLMVESSDGFATPIWVEPNDVGLPDVGSFDDLRALICQQTQECE